MKLQRVLEAVLVQVVPKPNSPSYLRKQALEMQQLLVDDDWDTKVQFTTTNTNIPCVIISCTKEASEMDTPHADKVIGYYIAEGSHHNVKGHEYVNWEVHSHGGYMTMSDIVAWLHRTYA
jgi:hypothetical protein